MSRKNLAKKKHLDKIRDIYWAKCLWKDMVEDAKARAIRDWMQKEIWEIVSELDENLTRETLEKWTNLAIEQNAITEKFLMIITDISSVFRSDVTGAIVATISNNIKSYFIKQLYAKIRRGK